MIILTKKKMTMTMEIGNRMMMIMMAISIMLFYNGYNYCY